MNNLSPINDINLKIFDEIAEERFSNIDLECLLVKIIDNLPADALPHLAEQYHITGNEGWLQCQTDADKRSLIKKAIELHRYKGTKYALINVLHSLNINGDIKEWFEYGGEPFFFKVVLYIFTRPVDAETEAKMIALINEYKNVRSFLDAIELNLASKVQEKICAHMSIGETIIIQNKEVA